LATDNEAHIYQRYGCKSGGCGPKAVVLIYVGTLKGMGRIHQQTFIDTYTKIALAKLYERENL
jgi:hypothetical protein